MNVIGLGKSSTIFHQNRFVSVSVDVWFVFEYIQNVDNPL